MTAPICPCERPTHPRLIANRPGLTLVDYRAGDFASFRRALLVPRPGERALAHWHPEPGGDLALQLVEWWAYLADVLTFYNERAIQEVLLRTAQVPEDVRRIVRLLGYRPRPGIGATGVVAALADAIDPFVVPRGLPIEGNAGPGLPPQIFEVDDDVAIGRIGRPLPRSARFPLTPPVDATATDPTAGPTPTTTTPGGDRVRDGGTVVALDDTGRVRNRVGAGPRRGPDRRRPRGGVPFDVDLDGVVAAVRPDDMVLIVKKGWLGSFVDPLGYVVSSVRKVQPLFDTAAPPVTRLQILSAHDLPAPIGDCLFLRPTRQAHLWLYHQRYPGSADPGKIAAGIAAQVVKTIFDPLGLFHGGGLPTRPPEDPRVLSGVGMMGATAGRGFAHLESVTRGIAAGDLVLFEKRTGGGIAGMFQRLLGNALPARALAPLRMLLMQLVKVTGYAEDIWFANAPEDDRVGMGPPVGAPGHGVITGGEGAIPIPHSRITFDVNPFLDAMAMGDLDLDKIVVHHGWEEIGALGDPPGPRPVTRVAVAPLPKMPPGPAPAIIVDRNGRGDFGWIGQTTPSDPRPPGTTTPPRPGTTGVTLVPPLQALINLLPVSRGETVTGEVLGSGDPTQARQELTLAQAPLTYLADTGPRAIDGYRSTLRIRVDGIEWTEVASFYGQPPTARVFVTREDDDQRTHVRFGDGEHGARLPAGVGNVIASYRVGSGAAVPVPGTLTTIRRPQRGLAAIVDAIPVGGGADPDPPEQLRRYAPRSVLTFGRAIAGDDYETVAAQTPGVRRARVTWGWDAATQRTVVKVFVGDDAPAVAAAREALAAFGDPNRPVVVALATPVLADLRLRLVVDPSYDRDDVVARVRARLLDPERRPFGAAVVRIGDAIYDSQIHDACRGVDGVVAVHGLTFGVFTPGPGSGDPGTGGSSGDDPPDDPGPPPRRLQDIVEEVYDTHFIPDDVYDPLGLAIRMHADEADMFDPFAYAGAIAARPSLLVPLLPPFALADAVTVERGERHHPGEGRFYVLREDRLQLNAEVARHVL